MPKALIVVTSHSDLGGTGRKTGWFLEEAAVPHLLLLDAGFEVDVASIVGGAAPVDPTSQPKPGEASAALARFLTDAEIQQRYAHSTPIAETDEQAYDLVYLPGGHGTMWDFPRNEPLERVISTVWAKGGVVGAVCHGPSGLVHTRGQDGRFLITDRRVAGFSNEEEEAVGLTETVPFLLEDALKAAGGRYAKGAPFTPFAIRDGRLVTGQNPMSSEEVGRLMVTAWHDR